jgi:hypothetical protein
VSSAFVVCLPAIAYHVGCADKFRDTAEDFFFASGLGKRGLLQEDEKVFGKDTGLLGGLDAKCSSIHASSMIGLFL